MRGESIARHVVVIKGAGEMASAVAHRLFRAGFTSQLLLELDVPLAIRRRVAFSEAIHERAQQVEGVTAVRVDVVDDVAAVWSDGRIAIMTDPGWRAIPVLHPAVVIDGILAKRNLGTRITDAPLVVALGPGFTAGVDAHAVVGTNRGHDLGRVHLVGGDEPNTGVPGDIAGRTFERVVRAPARGPFVTALDIGCIVGRGDVVGSVNGTRVYAAIDGVVRGLLRSGTHVDAGTKLADIDPRAERRYCETISDKARAIAGAVLEVVVGATTGAFERPGFVVHARSDA